MKGSNEQQEDTSKTVSRFSVNPLKPKSVKPTNGAKQVQVLRLDLPTAVRLDKFCREHDLDPALVLSDAIKTELESAATDDSLVRTIVERSRGKGYYRLRIPMEKDITITFSGDEMASLQLAATVYDNGNVGEHAKSQVLHVAANDVEQHVCDLRKRTERPAAARK